MQNLTNIILFPSENILKTEMRGSKGDLKRPFDRAWRDYQDKFSDLERTKKKQAKDAGMIRSELTAGEIAEEMDKERKYLQIAIADYMVKVNEIKTKKGVELLEHLVDYYKAQSRYRSHLVCVPVPLLPAANLPFINLSFISAANVPYSIFGCIIMFWKVEPFSFLFSTPTLKRPSQHLSCCWLQDVNAAQHEIVLSCLPRTQGSVICLMMNPVHPSSHVLEMSPNGQNLVSFGLMDAGD